MLSSSACIYPKTSLVSSLVEQQTRVLFSENKPQTIPDFDQAFSDQNTAPDPILECNLFNPSLTTYTQQLPTKYDPKSSLGDFLAFGIYPHANTAQNWIPESQQIAHSFQVESMSFQQLPSNEFDIQGFEKHSPDIGHKNDLSSIITDALEHASRVTTDTCVQNNITHAQEAEWDIKNIKLARVTNYDPYTIWPDGNVRHIYSISNERARRHQSGWAMRNTNNHNPQVLKKSCLGVLECSEKCKPYYLRPAICDKARKKQCMRGCFTPGCNGRLIQRNCRGHGGYPVTHFWRFANGAVYFEAKGRHDHARPAMKAFGCQSECEDNNYISTTNKESYNSVTCEEKSFETPNKVKTGLKRGRKSFKPLTMEKRRKKFKPSLELLSSNQIANPEQAINYNFGNLPQMNEEIMNKEQIITGDHMNLLLLQSENTQQICVNGTMFQYPHLQESFSQEFSSSPLQLFSQSWPLADTIQEDNVRNFERSAMQKPLDDSMLSYKFLSQRQDETKSAFKPLKSSQDATRQRKRHNFRVKNLISEQSAWPQGFGSPNTMSTLKEKNLTDIPSEEVHKEISQTQQNVFMVSNLTKNEGESIFYPVCNSSQFYAQESSTITPESNERNFEFMNTASGYEGFNQQLCIEGAPVSSLSNDSSIAFMDNSSIFSSVDGLQDRIYSNPTGAFTQVNQGACFSGLESSLYNFEQVNAWNSKGWENGSHLNGGFEANEYFVEDGIHVDTANTNNPSFQMLFNQA